MAVTWAKDPVETCISSYKPSTAQGSTVQEKGAYPPEKDMLKWKVKFGENTHDSTFFGAEPVVGVVTKFRKSFVDGDENKFPKWFTEDEYQKAIGGKKGGGGFGAVKPNLTPEQEIMDKAIGHAIGCIHNGLVAGDTTPVPATMANLDKLAEWAYKKISGAGKV